MALEQKLSDEQHQSQKLRTQLEQKETNVRYLEEEIEQMRAQVDS